MRRAAVLLLLFAVALVAPVSAGAAPSPAAHAAKLKKCKSGANAKKCRCPKGQKLVKKGRKYRCKKKKAAPQGQPGGDQGTDTGTNTDPGTGPNTDPGTGTNTDPGTGTGTGTPGGAQTERDDAGYTAALLAASRFGPRTDESSNGGIFTYTYDFCSNGQFSHHSEYYNSAFGSSESYYNGTWTLEQGFKVLQSTNGAKWAGILVISENDGTQSRIEVDLNDSASQFIVGNSAHLTGGLFSRAASVC